MKNAWSDEDAKMMINNYAKQGVSEDIALRVYTSRLLGNDHNLVLHGGGNTSVKTTMKDVMGDVVDVLCVKGSGWDLDTIEPAGLPAVRLEPLKQMVNLNKLSDEDMVNAQRGNLLDSQAPNPSVETLLHAFLPHKFIDHTHANAILALTDQTMGDVLCSEVFGKKFGLVPYIMPGFDLAKKALEVYLENPEVQGLILLKHGIFTFSDTAKQAYSRMIRAVTKAEKFAKQQAKKINKNALAPIKLPKQLSSAANIAPIIRGLTSHHGQPLMMDFRSNGKILSYVNAKSLKRISQQGTVTPDHVIRTKPYPLIAPAPEHGKQELFQSALKKAIDQYHIKYHDYFKRCNKASKIKKTELDPNPRVVLVPGVGLFGLGNSKKAARIAADLAETNIDVISDAERMGTYQVISEAEIFELEYWSLEQAKLGKSAEKPLQRKVVLVTGGGSGIGAATAQAFAAEGAAVAVLDLNSEAAQTIAAAIGGQGYGCDVTDESSLSTVFNRVVTDFGGIDIVVSNAGAAWQGRIGDVDEATLRKSFELNFWAHQRVASMAVKIMEQQGLGGCLLFNTSKQAVNPGRDFGPYGLPKAATLFLMKQYALDYGHLGIRANAVNADRIRSGLLTPDMIKSRSKSRGLSITDYMGGNLLEREVSAEDVAQGFVTLAKSEATTAAVLTVDGGNIAASMR